MTIQTAIKRMFTIAKERNYDSYYIALDVHDTIANATYNSNKLDYWPEAIDALKYISSIDKVKIILFTSSYSDSTEFIKQELEQLGIKIFAINENPGCTNTKTGDFSRKFYYSLLIDDKAGFERSDWIELKETFEMFIKCG